MFAADLVLLAGAFPVLLAVGYSSIAANVTNAVAFESGSHSLLLGTRSGCRPARGETHSFSDVRWLHPGYLMAYFAV